MWEKNSSPNNVNKAKPGSTFIAREKWARLKYVDRLFLKQIQESGYSFMQTVIKSNRILDLLNSIHYHRVNLNEIVLLEGVMTSYVHFAAAYSDINTLVIIRAKINNSFLFKC
jgi:hypothetical protein